MKVMIELTGITWNHTRGYLPLVATAQRYAEVHHDVSILWQKRSLQQFADAPLSDLASRFDMLVIDHPSIGEAAQQNLLLALDEYLPAEFLADQAATRLANLTQVTTTMVISMRLQSTRPRQSLLAVPTC